MYTVIGFGLCVVFLLLKKKNELSPTEDWHSDWDLDFIEASQLLI